MLMKPLVGRNEATRLVPRHDNFLFTFLPHDRVAIANGNDNDPTWTVAVGFFVQSRIEDRHMAGHLRVGKLNINTTAAGAAPRVTVKLVPSAHIRKKVAIPIGAPSPSVVQHIL